MRCVVVAAVTLSYTILWLAAAMGTACPASAAWLVHISGTVNGFPEMPGQLLGTSAHPGSLFDATVAFDPGTSALSRSLAVGDYPVTSFSLSFDGTPWLVDYSQQVVPTMVSVDPTGEWWAIRLFIVADGVHFPTEVPHPTLGSLPSDGGLLIDVSVNAASISDDPQFTVDCCDGYAGFWSVTGFAVPEPAGVQLLALAVVLLIGAKSASVWASRRAASVAGSESIARTGAAFPRSSRSSRST